MDTTQRLLMTGDVARRLGVSSDAVRRWAKQGRLPAIRTMAGARSGFRLFRLRDVESFAVARERRAARPR
jgi:excisionase family DNA binding protein